MPSLNSPIQVYRLAIHAFAPFQNDAVPFMVHGAVHIPFQGSVFFGRPPLFLFPPHVVFTLVCRRQTTSMGLPSLSASYGVPQGPVHRVDHPAHFPHRSAHIQNHWSHACVCEDPEVTLPLLSSDRRSGTTGYHRTKLSPLLAIYPLSLLLCLSLHIPLFF